MHTATFTHRPPGLRALLVFAAMVAGLAASPAAEVDWDSPRPIVSARDILLGGKLIAAVNMDNRTDSVKVQVGGTIVVFTPDDSLFSNAPFTTDFGPSTGDSGFDSILNRADWDPASSREKTIRINGLVPGADYAIQFFVADTRAAYNKRSMAIKSSPTNHFALVFMGDAGGSPTAANYVIGRFTADATFQEFIFTGVHDTDVNLSHPQLNAYVLRKVDEPNVQTGERRFNSFQYKASHNSFERSETLDKQIDDYNVWCVELDLKWDRDSDDNREIKVEHHCGSPHNAQTLNWELDELSQSKTAAYKVTCIYLQFSNASNAGCYDKWDQAAIDEALPMIEQSLEDELGAGTLYSSSEWINTDQQKWPSHQELSRRGYKWFVVLGEGGIDDIDLDGHPLFFTETVVSNWNSYIYAPQRAMASLNGGTDSSPTQYKLDAHGDRWLSRAYPDSQTGQSSDEYWDDALDNKFTFVASNAVDDGRLVDDTQTHSPVPLYVDNWDDNDKLWGTKAFPERYFGLAYERVSTGGLILIKAAAGETSYSDYPAAFTLSKSCVIRATGGGDAVLRVNP